MATIVLVSGAWHGRWCWEMLEPMLDALGHRTIAVELLGMGSDSTSLKDVTLARWADQVAGTVCTEKAPVVLLGHSRGGIIISEVAERVPDSVNLLIYLSAFLLRDRQTLGATAQASRGSRTSFVVPGSDGTTTTIAKEAVGSVLYNTTSPDLVRRAEGAVGVEPMKIFSTPLHLSEERFGRVPRAYIECLRDNAVPISLQRSMQAALPCSQVETLDTDHSPFFSAPDLLARAIDRLVQSGKLKPRQTG